MRRRRLRRPGVWVVLFAILAIVVWIVARLDVLWAERGGTVETSTVDSTEANRDQQP